MRFLIRVLAVFGLLFIALIGLGIYGATRIHLAGHTAQPVVNDTVLTLTVAGPFAEEGSTRASLSNALGGHGRKLREIVEGIDRAAQDTRVKGLVIKVDASAGMAQTQELRAAIKRFRGAGKFAYAFADDYGETASGNGQYYLAAACDQVWLQPMGEVMLTDIAFEAPFLKDALAKIDVEPEFVKRAEYKTAPETFTERGYTPAAREMMESLANDLTLQLVGDIATSRNMPADDVRALLARGPMTADEAAQAKLVDKIGYADEVVSAARKAAGADAHIVPLTDYSSQMVAQNASAPNIALIYETGDIKPVMGPIDAGGGNRDGQNPVVRGFVKAMAASSVKTVVLRVDSPGGAVTGSESIRRMIVLAKQAGKKVVVSMGPVAASGGYWISADADKIVADPATLTGSIGVFSGKFVVGKGLADLGVTVDRTAAGPYTGMDSPFTPFTPDQTQKLNATIDSVYDGFVSRVAEGRKMPPGTVGQIAKGRVWSGQQAKQIGLVDALGGLTEAVALAREIGGIPDNEPTKIAVYPEPLSPVEAVRALLSGETDIQEEAGAALADIDGPAGAAIRTLAPLFRNPRSDFVRMPDLGTVR
jgi:protease-4